MSVVVVMVVMVVVVVVATAANGQLVEIPLHQTNNKLAPLKIGGKQKSMVSCPFGAKSCLLITHHFKCMLQNYLCNIGPFKITCTEARL